MLGLLEKTGSRPQEINSVGLSSQEAAVRLARDGENTLAQKKKSSALKIFAGQFHDIMVVILMAATVVSVLLGEFADAVPILLIIVINAFLGFFQEYRCEKTLEKLREMTAPSARCYRDGVLVRIPSAQIVCGDVIALEAGDRVPCDAFVLSSSAMECDEAVLTGESLPVGKKARQAQTDFSSLNCDYMCYMGTVVTKGSGVVCAVSTGKNTQMGKVSTMLEDIDEGTTPLQKKLGELGKVLALICLGVCVLVFIAGVLRGEPVLDMVMTGITIAVAAIPEGLPAAVTIALALAVRRMLRRQALVHKLHSVETLGCATVICTDKTGTLTRSRMTVTDIAAFSGELKGYRINEVKGIGTLTDMNGEAVGELSQPGNTALRRLLECACVCSNARLESRNAKQFSATGDPTEAALVCAAAVGGVFEQETGAQRIEEIPFDSNSRCMTVICRDAQGKRFSFKKGSCDVILADCGFCYEQGEVRHITNEERLAVSKRCDSYAAQGLRVLALEEARDEKRIFLGLAAMKDPPRPEAAGAVARCARAGIKTVMITGDHKLTAQAIAAETGIYTKGSLVVTGAQLDGMSDEKLDSIIENCTVFARVSPAHKLRIVQAFRRRGHVCAMTGDGVNDAPAVKEADIGVSMGVSGTEVTKQAAEIILLDDNFATLVNAVEEGRTIYKNIRKFVRYLISCNIGEVLTMLGSIVMGLPVILLPVQILLVNLVTDSLPAVALGLEPPEKSFMTDPPRSSQDSFFSGGLLWKICIRGVLIALCTLACFTLLLSRYGSIEIARTGALCTLVISQLIHVFECRSENGSLPGMSRLSNPFLLFSVAVSAFVLFVGIYLPAMQKIVCTYPLNRTQLVLSLGCAFVVPLLSAVFSRRRR